MRSGYHLIGRYHDKMTIICIISLLHLWSWAHLMQRMPNLTNAVLILFMLTFGPFGLTPLTTRLRVILDCEEVWGLTLFSHLLPQEQSRALCRTLPPWSVSLTLSLSVMFSNYPELVHKHPTHLALYGTSRIHVHTTLWTSLALA